MSEPMTHLDATIADLRVALGIPSEARVEEVGAHELVIPDVRVRELLDEIDRLRAQREAVLKLHPREVVERYAGPPNITCGHCMASSRHRAAWPCPTARALGVTDA